MKNELPSIIVFAVIVGAYGVLAMTYTPPKPRPQPTPRTIEVFIGALCPTGAEIVTSNWNDPALDGCK
ncbi:MAG: hypothetical protein ACK4ZW_11760 [Blastomonas sp.]